MGGEETQFAHPVSAGSRRNADLPPLLVHCRAYGGSQHFLQVKEWRLKSEKRKGKKREREGGRDSHKWLVVRKQVGLHLLWPTLLQ